MVSAVKLSEPLLGTRPSGIRSITLDLLLDASLDTGAAYRPSAIPILTGRIASMITDNIQCLLL